MLLISSLPNALSNLVFSTFNILPLKGNIACVIESLPSLALPPALSPSTMNISETVGSLLLQSDNLPKKLVIDKSDFLVASLAFLAALLALLASIAFSTIIFASVGFSIKNLSNPSAKILSAIFLTSEFPNLPLV